VGVAFDGNAVWVSNFQSSNVTKLRASDGTFLGSFPTGINPYFVAFDGAFIWTANWGSNTASKL